MTISPLKKNKKGKGGPPSSAPKTLATAKFRERQALELRSAGKNYQQIADIMKMSLSGARKCVIRSLEYIQNEITEKAHEVRSLELGRLDLLLDVAMEAVIESKDLGAIDKVVKIMERRAKLLGLDQPTQMDILVSTPQQVREENRIKIVQVHPEMTDDEVESALTALDNMSQ